jgi:hypothetical protein
MSICYDSAPGFRMVLLTSLRKPLPDDEFFFVFLGIHLHNCLNDVNWVVTPFAGR